MHRRGQVSLFVIIGLIALVTVIIVVSFSGGDPPDAYLPEPYTQFGDVALVECIDSALAGAILDIGTHGGYPASIAAQLTTQGLATTTNVPYALLRPDEHEEGRIIDAKYLEPSTMASPNRFGKLKLLPLKGPISFESFLAASAQAKLDTNCAFEEGGTPTITYEGLSAHIEPSEIQFLVSTRHTHTGTLEESTFSYDVRLGRAHDDLKSLLMVLANVPGYPISENEFSEELSYTWSSRVLTLTDDESDLNGNPFTLSVGIEERFPLLKNLRCSSNTANAFHPDFDVPLLGLVDSTCSTPDGALEEAVIRTSDGEERTISGVLSI